MKNGNDINIEANNTTVWWHGKPHSIKEKNSFVNIIQGLFFIIKEMYKKEITILC